LTGARQLARTADLFPDLPGIATKDPRQTDRIVPATFTVAALQRIVAAFLPTRRAAIRRIATEVVVAVPRARG
jgi:hypothetical protein